MMKQIMYLNRWCNQGYLFACILSFLGMISTATASPNCFNSQIESWTGYKYLNIEQVQLLENRLDTLCKLAQSKNEYKAAAELLSRASVLKMGVCNDRSISPKFTQKYVGNDPVKNILYRQVESIKLFCKYTRYDDRRSLLDEYKKYTGRLDVLKEDLFCLSAVQDLEVEGWRGSLASIMGVADLPSIVELRKKSKIICQDLKLNKITLHQANELLKYEQMFKAPELKEDLINLTKDSLISWFATPFRLLAWLVGVGGGLVGLIIGIRKLME